MSNLTPDLTLWAVSLILFYESMQGFPGGTVVKNPPAKQETWVQSLGWEDPPPPEQGNGNSLQYSCLGNAMDRGAWQALVHGVAKSWTPLSTHMPTHTHTHLYQLPEISYSRIIQFY